MPNHCEQDVVVTGDVKTLQEFKAYAEEGEGDDKWLLSANKFIPYPKVYKDRDEEAKVEHAKGNYSFKDGFNAGGYEWCCQNWGTKWGIYSTSIVSEKLTGKKGRIKYTCQSAWSPAIPIFTAMSEKFPTLRFDIKYFESGAAYKGQLVLEGGQTLKDERSAYNGRRGG
jgi:Ferredoxin-like domain in Api92-like protein